jgi:pSer/pThr/pTyr-binding forkhead associated (FHA) protein
VKAFLNITEATGKTREMELDAGATYTIGRSQDNDIVLNDRRVSRRHALIVSEGNGFKLVDGYFENGQLQRSVNRVFVNGLPLLEKVLDQGDQITIGASRLEFERIAEDEPRTLEQPTGNFPIGVNYDDQPLGHTQLLMSADDIINRQTSLPPPATLATNDEIRELRRKAQILEMFYEMSKTLGTVFDLKEIFVKATDLIFRGTPADRVVALLADETLDGKILDYSLYPIATRARNEKLEKLTEKLTISRTITQKVMRERVALLSQDVTSDAQFSQAVSIVAQGVRRIECSRCCLCRPARPVFHFQRRGFGANQRGGGANRRYSRNRQVT